MLHLGSSSPGRPVRVSTLTFVVLTLLVSACGPGEKVPEAECTAAALDGTIVQYTNADLTVVICDQGYAIANVSNVPEWSDGVGFWKADNGTWVPLTVLATTENVESNIPEGFPAELVERWRKERNPSSSASPARPDCTPSALGAALATSDHPKATVSEPIVCEGDVAVATVQDPPNFTGGVGLFVSTDEEWSVSRISTEPTIATSELFQDAYARWKDALDQQSAGTTTTSSTLPG